MINEAVKTMRTSMEKSIESFKVELGRVRTGRANASMLDGIRVDYYGTPTPLSQVGSVNVPEPKMIVIQPWEINLLKDIETAIQKSDIGLNPMNDGKVIRLKIPDLTEERRKDLVKQLKKYLEECHVSIRMARRDAMDKLKNALKDKKITEDDNKKGGEQIQKVTDEFVKKADEVAAAKEKDILTV
jgi:ribosome recycling factor